MKFAALQRRVQRREHLLEQRAQRVGERWSGLKTTWRDAWTPGRIIVAGLASGFLVGRAEPLRGLARSGQWMQLASTLGSLFAGGLADIAAAHAEDIAATVAADGAGTTRQAASAAAEPVEP